MRQFTPATQSPTHAPAAREVPLGEQHERTLESEWLNPEEFYLQCEEDGSFEQYRYL